MLEHDCRLCTLRRRVPQRCLATLLLPSISGTELICRQLHTTLHALHGILLELAWLPMVCHQLPHCIAGHLHDARVSPMSLHRPGANWVTSLHGIDLFPGMSTPGTSFRLPREKAVEVGKQPTPMLSLGQ